MLAMCHLAVTRSQVFRDGTRLALARQAQFTNRTSAMNLPDPYQAYRLGQDGIAPGRMLKPVGAWRPRTAVTATHCHPGQSERVKEGSAYVEANSSRWTTVADSPHDHEREALAFLRRRLPDREPYRVWSNFEFTTANGLLYEVDALAITDNGVHLIEIKSHPGQIGGDGATWQWKTPGGAGSPSITPGCWPTARRRH